MGIGRRRLLGLVCGLAGLPLAALLARANAADGEPSSEKSKPAADEKALEALWLDLEKDEAVALRALFKMSDYPREAVALFKKKLKALLLDVDRLNELVAKIGSADENEWKPAFEELEYFDPRLAVDLQTMMTNVKEPMTRQRLVALLSGREPNSLLGKEITLRAVGEGFNFMATPNFGSFWAEHKVSNINKFRGGDSDRKKWNRAVRAMALLEHIGSPNAIAVLNEMASGHPVAQPTRVAVEALVRLEAKGR